ncbi:MAG: hypothetical protein ACI4OS_06155 [Akkermansia sp.]
MRYAAPGVALGVLLLLSGGLGVFYLVYAPNWDVPLLYAAVFGVLLLPMLLWVRFFWTQRVVQVAHEGVVLSEYLWGHLVARRAWPSDRVRAFAWEREADGALTLRLLLLRADGQKTDFFTLWTMDNPYAFAALWRDFELHYPGSGLRPLCFGEEPAAPAPRARRGWAGALVVLSVLGGVAVANPMLHPLSTALRGTTEPARICALDWEPDGSRYVLLMQTERSGRRLRSASAFAGAAPRPGTRLMVLHDGDARGYLTNEVSAFFLPLLLGGACLLPLSLALFSLLRPAVPRR